MAVTFTNELKKFEGQPWSAWTDFIGCIVPPDTVQNNSVNITINKNDSSGTMRLNKSDMAIYGQYPGAETFELAVCEFCGDKFKLAALANHIELRHQDGKKVPAMDITSAALSSKAKLLQLELQKKGKSRYNKHVKDRNEKTATLSGNKVKTKTNAVIEEKSSSKQPIMNENDNSDNYVESPLNKLDKNSKPEKTDQQQSLSTLLKQDHNKLKNLKLKLRKSKEANDLCSAKILNSKIGKNGSVLNTSVPPVAKTKEKQKLENVIRKTIVKTEQAPIQAPSSPSTPPEIQKSPEEIAFMQPVVQLTPIVYSECSVKVLLPDSKRRLKNDKKIFAMKDRTYNPDRHCGVVGKENTKPCTRSLTCKSHSMSLRRAVRGRSKAFDMLLADHRAEKEMFKQKLLGNNVATPVETPEVIISAPSPTATEINTNSRVESELQKFKPKPTRNSVAEYSRLSLPVSIKNPNIFTSLQNQNDKGKPHFNNNTISNSTISNTVRLLGASSILKNQVANPLLARQENISSSVNTLHTSLQSQQPQVQPQLPKNFPVKHWCPGYRRMGGLLYSHSNLPRINGFVTSKTENSIIVESIPVQNIPQSTSTMSLMQSKTFNSVIHQLSASPQPELLKRFPLSLGPGKKKTVATLIPKQPTSLLMPNVISPGQSPLSGHSLKKTAAVLQMSSPQIKNGVIYYQNQVGAKRFISDDVNISPKRIKRDAKVIVGPIISKSNSGNTVMRFSISNGVLEKEIVTNSNGFLPGCRSLPPGVSLLQNNGVRLQSARIHYVTSSGPLPVTLQQLPIVPQNNCY